MILLSSLFLRFSPQNRTYLRNPLQNGKESWKSLGLPIFIHICVMSIVYSESFWNRNKSHHCRYKDPKLTLCKKDLRNIRKQNIEIATAKSEIINVNCNCGSISELYWLLIITIYVLLSFFLSSDLNKIIFWEVLNKIILLLWHKYSFLGDRLIQIAFPTRNSRSVQHTIWKDRGSSCYRSRCSTSEKYVEPLMRITVQREETDTETR